ncbi:MAG: hypothetical protein Q8N39_08710 [Pelolinea sp.]|nr:hypothetical protein [Pelolinea sp.]
MKKNNKQSNAHKPRKSFPVWGIIILAVMFFAAALPLLRSTRSSNVATEVTGAPKIKVDQEYLDYGDVKNGGTPIRTVIQVSNVGDQTLNFTEAPYIELLDGCCPPVPAIGSLVLKPGESTTLVAEFFMHGQMGSRHDFRLHLTTNDPAEPDKTISIISNWVD